MRELYKNVPVLDSGARGSTDDLRRSAASATCCSPGRTRRYLALDERPGDKVEIVVPSLSILAEPPVAVVDKSSTRHGTREVAEAYLEFLYTPEGQEIAAQAPLSAARPKVAAKYARDVPAGELFTIDEVFGGWDEAQKTHFADGGIFDQIYQPGAEVAA